jgi:hypothetical protein
VLVTVVGRTVVLVVVGRSVLLVVVVGGRVVVVVAGAPAPSRTAPRAADSVIEVRCAPPRSVYVLPSASVRWEEPGGFSSTLPPFEIAPDDAVPRIARPERRAEKDVVAWPPVIRASTRLRADRIRAVTDEKVRSETVFALRRRASVRQKPHCAPTGVDPIDVGEERIESIGAATIDDARVVDSTLEADDVGGQHLALHVRIRQTHEPERIVNDLVIRKCVPDLFGELGHVAPPVRLGHRGAGTWIDGRDRWPWPFPTRDISRFTSSTKSPRYPAPSVAAASWIQKSRKAGLPGSAAYWGHVPLEQAYGM